MISFGADVTGLDDVLKKLNKLPEKIHKNVVTKAIRAGAKPIVKEAKHLVQDKSSNLKKSIGVTKRKSKSKTDIRFTISPRTGGKNYSGWYGHFVEFGTRFHAPIPFMVPAFEKEGENAIKEVRKSMKQNVDKEIAKL